MKKYIIIPFVTVLAIAILASCKKYTKLLNNVPVDRAAYLKVVHVAPGFTKVFNAPDNFNVVVGGVNGTRIAAAMTYNSVFPSNTLNTNTYAAVPSGSQDIRLVLKGVVNIDSNTVATIPKNLVPGNYYTLIITDSITTTADYSKIWVADNFTAPALGNYSVRFIHAAMNDTAGKKIDVYSTKQVANLFTNVAPGDVSGFFSFPITTAGSTGDTIIIRRAGTMNELDRYPRNATGQPSAISYTNNQRVYTILYKGDATFVSTTALPKGRSIYVWNNR